MDAGSCYEILTDRVVLKARVSPGASKNAIQGVRDGELWVRIAAAPERGRANQELVRYLAGLLQVSRSAVALASGDTSRHKRLSLPRGSLAGLQALLTEAARG